MYGYDIFAHEAELYAKLPSDDPYSREPTPKSLSEIVDFSKFLTLPMTPMIHTVSCAEPLCYCPGPSDHEPVMRRLGGNTRSDMTIKCHGRVYHADRKVVCGKSWFFNRAMNGCFKESITGTIELPDDDPDILEYFLEFLYTGDYTNCVRKCWPCTDRFAELGEALERWFLTSDYRISWDFPESDKAKGMDTDEPHTGKGIEDLITWCENDFDKNLEEYLAHPKTHRSDPCVNMRLPLSLYIMAVKYGVEPLADLARKRFTTEFVKYKWKYMPQVVDELYQNTLSKTDWLIRKAVVEALVEKMHKHKSVFLIFQPVMLKHSDFAVELLQGFFSFFYSWSEPMGTSLLFPLAMQRLNTYRYPPEPCIYLNIPEE